jgi:Carbohydrate family 9 binding domain-like
MKAFDSILLTLLTGLLPVPASAALAQSPSGLAEGVRGLATRAPKTMTIDGNLEEFQGAFCTPVEYSNDHLRNRAGQFFYMWDEEAFYAGLRTLDTHPANPAPDDRLWEGDAVEWYFDTRQNQDFRSQAWPKTPSPGAVHCYWTGLKGTNVQGRFCLRPGFLEAIPKTGIEVGSRRTAVGMEVEFKLPWANFPAFKAAAGTIIALDAELCYSDGGPRVFRSFAYGSPLSVQEPASLGKIQLVEKLEPNFWGACGPVMMPIRCDTAWTQSTQPRVTGSMAIPPDQGDQIGKVVFRVLGLDGKTLGDFPGSVETFEEQGRFRRAQAQWPTELAVPGAHLLLGLVYDRQGQELARVAPRLVSVNMTPGY